MMTMPFSLPNWMPVWLLIGITCVLAGFALAFLLMPFAVFGLKARLSLIDARLDELQGEIRRLSLRLPEQAERVSAPIPPANVEEFPTTRLSAERPVTGRSPQGRRRAEPQL
jgi:hypothetical protein